MNRAGLLNFWYYDDEIFDFADGKLLLRGSNGSGKSVTMQSILPILLDGRKSPDRLDPFGSRARKMEDYLLGEKEIVDRDERTGYLFLEYKRENTNQYITTGIGLQARRYKNLNSWYFIITDNRRIGKDLLLYEHEYHAGEKQQIPLSRIQLENRIDAGGHVVRTQKEYMQLVNKYLFGFETMDAYEDLVKLLIQLRSPKLSKDFRPTVIYEILEAALPPLTDEDLRHLSDTIEHMDQTKQQIEQLEREHEALKNVTDRYHTYNQYRLVETAHHYVENRKKLSKEEKLVKEKEAEKQRLSVEIDHLTMRNQELEQLSDTLSKKQKRLEQHEVWNLEEERANEMQLLGEIEQEYDKKDKTVTEKTKQEFVLKERTEQLMEKMDAIDKEMKDQIIHLETDAAEVSFERHSLNSQDFERKKEEDFDFTIWKQETENHYTTLDTISEKLMTFEQMKDRIATVEKTIANYQQEIDQKRSEENDWMNVFEKDKQEKMNEIYHWAEKHPFMQIDETLLQQTSRHLGQLYETHVYETIRAPFFHINNDYQLQVNEKIATKQSERAACLKQMEEKQSLLAEWKAKRDPEPPGLRDETKEARQKLKVDNHSFIPFYEAVEFQDHIEEDMQKKIEAALMDVGILDALIVDGEIPYEHDRILKADPQMMAHTLADYLKVDVEETTKVPASTVDDVLRSIVVAGEDTDMLTTIGIDGTYKIGLMEGHAVPVESVRFIGKNARKRYRDEQIRLISAEIAALEVNEHQILEEIQQLKEQIAAARKAMEIFPNDKDLQTAYAEIETCRLHIGQLEQQLVVQDQQWNKWMSEFHRLKRDLDTATRGLNIAFTYEAYQEAKHVHRRYEKDLNHLEKLYVTYHHEQINLAQTKERLQEIELEVDELKGELHLLLDKKTRVQHNIVEIEKQLEAQGMTDIRQQIKSVQDEIITTSKELLENQSVLPRKEASVEMLEKEIIVQQQRTRFYHVLINAWKISFQEEIHYGFVDIPEELEENDHIAKWIVKEYNHLMKDAAKIEEQLTKVFFEQHSNLMEYRMTDHMTDMPEIPEVFSDEWTEDQQILLENWKNKATRRIIQLDFQGKRLSPYYVLQMVEDDRSRQQTLLNDQDRQLYEEILFDSVGNKLRSRIYRAQQWTKEMDQLMKKSDSTSGISFSIQWKPRTAETEAELDTKELVDLLRRDPRLLKEEDLHLVMEHFRSKIDRAKELIEMKGEGNTLLQVLKEVLDYRYWFSFVLSYERVGESKKELTNNAFYKFSGGEKAMAMYIPLFTACYSRYLEADSSAPYIISLDEAFAGVDDDNISVMFGIVEELGFDYIMNSQVLWGDYHTVSALSICELVRPKNASFVTVIRYEWDGRVRKLVVDEKDDNQDEGTELDTSDKNNANVNGDMSDARIAESRRTSHSKETQSIQEQKDSTVDDSKKKQVEHTNRQVEFNITEV